MLFFFIDFVFNVMELMWEKLHLMKLLCVESSWNLKLSSGRVINRKNVLICTPCDEK